MLGEYDMQESIQLKAYATPRYSSRQHVHQIVQMELAVGGGASAANLRTKILDFRVLVL